MSILIKGIDLPKEGEVKVIDMYGDGSIFVGNGTEYKMYPQAIQIPKGVRLIDANRLLNKYKKQLEALDVIFDTVRKGHYRTVLVDICNDLEDAPTILESEVMPK